MKAATARNLGVAAAWVGAIAAVGSLIVSGVANISPTRTGSYGQEATSKPTPLHSVDGNRATSFHSKRTGQTGAAPPNLTNHGSHEVWSNQEFALADQQQKSVVPGCASISAKFHDIDSVKVLTLRINTDGASDSHAISDAGEQFSFSCGDSNYRALVLRVDHENRTVEVGVEKTKA